ncbi:MAG TPA: TorF family putative porin [Paenalcaligenes sp.]|nr:TorF family putative porin [Paenalcaligenes sp.]
MLVRKHTSEMPLTTVSITAPLQIRPWLTTMFTAVTFCCLYATTAQAEYSFELDTVSLYKDRGEDQDEKNTNFRPALQGAWQYQHSSGVFVGNWVSTGKFGRASLQLDTTAGYGVDIGENARLEAGYTHSIYPHEGSLNSNEIFTSFSYQNLTLEVFRGLRSGVNNKDMYYNFDYVHPIDARWSLGAGMGYEHFGDSDEKSKIDYRAGVFYQLNNISTVSLVFAGANRKHAVENGIRDNRVILGLNLDF